MRRCLVPIIPEVIFNNTAPADQGQGKPASEADLIKEERDSQDQLTKAMEAHTKQQNAYGVDPTKMAQGYSPRERRGERWRRLELQISA